MGDQRALAIVEVNESGLIVSASYHRLDWVNGRRKARYDRISEQSKHGIHRGGTLGLVEDCIINPAVGHCLSHVSEKRPAIIPAPIGKNDENP